MKKRYRILGGGAFLLIALLVTVRPEDKIGIVDDLGDVDLERGSAFAERSNAAYHEEKNFRYEYGQQVEEGSRGAFSSFPAGQLASNPGHWVAAD